VTTCEICGTEFDELGVQIVVPGLAKSFDRIDCAARARALAGPPARDVRPARAIFVDIAPRGPSRSYGLHGLPAGLAAAVSGMRARLALGGASAAAVVLFATTAHLALRGDDAPDEQAGSRVIPSPQRYGAHDRTRAQPVEARLDARATRPAIAGQDATRLVAYRFEANEPGLTMTATQSPAAGRKLTATKKVRNTARKTFTRAARTTSTKTAVSTRPGWGRGDKNHVHGGPAKRAGAGKLGKKRHK
jgi:hypothetical protein